MIFAGKSQAEGYIDDESMDFNESEQKLYKYDLEDRNDIYSMRLVYK